MSGERLQDHWSSGLIFALKYRLWVLVRNASLRRFKRVPTINVQRKKIENIMIFHLKIIFLQP